MGDINRLIKNGVLCKCCGTLINKNDLNGPGHERLCDTCKEQPLTCS